jgi:hypothetical protein
VPPLIEVLVTYARARVAELRRQPPEAGVSEIVAILVIIAAVIAIAGAVFGILRAKAETSANNKNF